jgi:hypothetical protein
MLAGGVGFEPIERAIAEHDAGEPVGSRAALDESVDERGDVAGPLRQRRHFHRNHAQPKDGTPPAQAAFRRAV